MVTQVSIHIFGTTITIDLPYCIGDFWGCTTVLIINCLARDAPPQLSIVVKLLIQLGEIWEYLVLDVCHFIKWIGWTKRTEMYHVRSLIIPLPIPGVSTQRLYFMFYSPNKSPEEIHFSKFRKSDRELSVWSRIVATLIGMSPSSWFPGV